MSSVSVRTPTKHGDKEHLHCVSLFTKRFHRHYRILKCVHTNKTNVSILQIIYIDKQCSTSHRSSTIRERAVLTEINVLEELKFNPLNAKHLRQS